MPPRKLPIARKGPDTPQTSPPPKKQKTLDAPAVPVAQEKQTDNKQPMDVLMQIDLAKTVDENYDQFKKEMERIQKHGTRNFMVTNEFAEKMKEICEKAGALNALSPESVNIHLIRKRIQLTIKNCKELFTKEEFCVESNSIELVGFNWHLEATTEENGFLGLFLVAIPPDGFTGNYRIEVDYSFSVWNSLAGRDLVEKRVRHTMKEKCPIGTGLGCDMAKLKDLLDPDKTFLTPEGDIEVWVDFTIKSATLNHLV